ncbi:hypothetical protein JCM14469_05290 [Desulfatiferula olefinivorans]
MILLRVLSFFALLICLFAGQPAFSADVTQEDAKNAAVGWLKQSRARMGDSLPTHIKNVEDYNNYYVVNLNPEGFIILSADDLAEPIVAFSANGSFIPDANNPLFTLLSIDMPERKMAAQELEIEIERLEDNRQMWMSGESFMAWGRAVDSRSKWADLRARGAADDWSASEGEPDDSWERSSSVSDVRIAPLIQSKWSQTTAQGMACYNYYCPPGAAGSSSNYPSGCVATAMGQLMRFWQHPASASGNTYVYANMPLDPQTDATLTQTERMAIGRILRDAGAAVSMSYGPSESSANLLIVDDRLKDTFGYTNAVDMYISDGIGATDRNKVLCTNLAAGLPVIMGIRGTVGGHAVVTDGFGYTSGTLYYHVNLGWGGSSDAWYNLPTVDTTSYNFTAVNAFIYNAYTSGTGELIAGRITDTAGNPVSGATVSATGGYTATTNSTGYYGIRVPASSTYTVTASKSGMKTASISGISVGRSASYTVCGNYWGADLSLNAFSFTASALGDSVVLRWTKPSTLGMSSDTVYIRHSTSDYPATSEDGTLVYSGTLQEFEHTERDGTGTVTNYYTIWGNDGSPYDALSPDSDDVHATGTPDASTVGMYWYNSANGDVFSWNLAKTGLVKGETPTMDGANGYVVVANDDYDDDGVKDLVWYSSATARVYVWFMGKDGYCDLSKGERTIENADGSYVYTGKGLSGYQVVATGDYNGDSVTDLVWYSAASGKVYVWFMNTDGDGKISMVEDTGWAYTGQGLSGYEVVATHDYNDDGLTDLVWYSASGGKVYVWFMNTDGNGKLSLVENTGWAYTGQGLSGYEVVATGDYNGDSVYDLVWYSAASGKVYVWFMNTNGDGKISLVENTGWAYTAQGLAGYEVVSTGDYNGDSVTDLVWYSAASGKVYVWFMNTDGNGKISMVENTGWAYSGQGLSGYSVVVAGDCNKDSIRDLVWYSTTAGKVYVWFMNTDGNGKISMVENTGWAYSGPTQGGLTVPAFSE